MMKHRIDFTSTDKHGVYRYVFRSETSGGVRAVEIDHDNREYSTEYNLFHPYYEATYYVTLKTVHAAIEWAKANGYTEV